MAGEAVLGPQAGKDLATGIRDLVRGRGPGYEKEIAQGRSAAIRAMVEDAVARGAHAVVAVKVDYESVAGTLLVTATGTAVTLKSRG
ncbi:MAG: YbjQ family protein [Actinomycetota bacterium]|nr:YbjQ family protein [Actinomycetota bacterium]